MELPEDCELAYIVGDDAWYAEASRSVKHYPDLQVLAADVNGQGCAWEFQVEERDLAGPSVRVCMFNDAFDAFQQVPEFFTALTWRAPSTLAEVRTILDELGARDVTPRTSPYTQRGDSRRP